MLISTGSDRTGYNDVLECNQEPNLRRVAGLHSKEDDSANNRGYGVDTLNEEFLLEATVEVSGAEEPRHDNGALCDSQ